MGLYVLLALLVVCLPAARTQSKLLGVTGIFNDLPCHYFDEGLELAGRDEAGSLATWVTGHAVDAVNVTAGAVLLLNVKLADASLAPPPDPAVDRGSPPNLLVPRVLAMAPGVSLSMVDVKITTSCDELVAQQAYACSLLPWAAVTVGPGSLHVAGWRSGPLSLSNVTASCEPELHSPLPKPPCIATVAGSAAELAIVLQQLHVADDEHNGTIVQQSGPPAPAYVRLTANISFLQDAGWPSDQQPLITRNLTIVGSPLVLSAVSTRNVSGGTSSGDGGSGITMTTCCPGDTGPAAAMPLVADGWTWPSIIGIDMAARWNLMSVDGEYGVLTFIGLVLENMVIGSGGAQIPMALVSGQFWGVNLLRPTRIWAIDVVLVQSPAEYEYWLYWMTLASSPAPEMAMQARWLLSIFPNSKGYGLSRSAIHLPILDSPRVLCRRVIATSVRQIAQPINLPNGLGTILPDKKVPLTDLVGASTCQQLAAALQADGRMWRPVIIVTLDISLAIEHCPEWPEEGVAVLRDTTIVGNVGRRFVHLDIGFRVGAIRVLDEGVTVTLKGLSIVGNNFIAGDEKTATASQLGVWTHNLYGILQTRPKVHVILYNVTLEVPAEEVALVAALARQRPAPLNTLPPAQLTFLRAVMQPSCVSANSSDPYTVLPGSTRLGGSAGIDSNVALVFSEFYGWGVRGINVALTSNSPAWLVPRLRGAVNPYNRSPVAVSYLGGPRATSDGLGPRVRGMLMPGWAIAVVVGAATTFAVVLLLCGLWLHGHRYSTTVGAYFHETEHGKAGAVDGGPVALAKSSHCAGGRTGTEVGTPQSHALRGPALLASPGASVSCTASASPDEAPASSDMHLHDLSTADLPKLGLMLCSRSGSQYDNDKLHATLDVLLRARQSSSRGPSGDSGRGRGLGRYSSVGRIVEAHRSASATSGVPSGGSGGPIPDTDSFDRPPSEFEAASSSGERAATEELAALVAGLREEMSAAGEELVISEVLGSGAFGVVYKGTWKGLAVAVKTLRFNDRLYGNERARRAALKEAAICCSLNHPNVVSTYTYELKPVKTVVMEQHTAKQTADGTDVSAQHLYDSGTRGSTSGGLRILEPEIREWKLFLVHEFCAGGTLRELVDRGAYKFGNSDLPLISRAVNTALEVAAGMAHIHSKNVVHGDLNPNNVLMGFSTPPAPHPLVAKIADFGLSFKLGAGQTHVSNVCCGTPPYVSPEVMSRGQLTKAADVWSMGLILWELAHGRPPWRRTARPGHVTRKGHARRMHERRQQQCGDGHVAVHIDGVAATAAGMADSSVHKVSPATPGDSASASQLATGDYDSDARQAGRRSSAGPQDLIMDSEPGAIASPFSTVMATLPLGRPPPSGSVADCDGAEFTPPTIDPSSLAWSAALPAGYAALGAACLALEPEARPSMPQLVRRLIALQREVDEAVARAATAAAAAAHRVAAAAVEGPGPDGGRGSAV